MGGILLIFESRWWTYNVLYSILSTSQFFFFFATPYSMQVFSSPTRYQTCGRVKSLLLDHQGSPSTLPKYFYYLKKKKRLGESRKKTRER